jgi:hypothetical protein
MAVKPILAASSFFAVVKKVPSALAPRGEKMVGHGNEVNVGRSS